MLERINQLEREKRQREKEKREREAAEASARQRAELERQQKAKRENEERGRFLRETNRRILHESGVIPALSDIERGRLKGTTANHTLIVNPDRGIATLAWGTRFIVEDGRIGYEKPFLGFGRGEKDYSYIEVCVDPDRRGIKINDRFLSEQEWRNRELVLDWLAKAYLNPRRVNEREPNYRSESSSSSSGTTECCHS